MILIRNKRAKYEYDIRKSMTAGIILTGPEVKSLRQKAGSLAGSYVKIIGDEPWLINAQINSYAYAVQTDYDPRHSRKLLLTKKQIYKLKEYLDFKNLSAVPLTFELIANRIKVKIGIGKGKKEYQKKEKVKERELKRRMAKEFKQGKLKI